MAGESSWKSVTIILVKPLDSRRWIERKLSEILDDITQIECLAQFIDDIRFHLMGEGSAVTVSARPADESGSVSMSLTFVPAAD